ncbi:MAG: hypothetical protein QME12_03915 [Nanoarchaeota archaeon]|nr:hypothetical protein [Nanoarchaeota archaeon]
MKIQPYKQTTSESCLACCLLQLRYFHTGKKITQKNERNMLFHALRYSRMDFVAGHLDFFEKQFSLKTRRYVHNKILYELVKNECKTDMQIRKIDINFINEMTKAQLIALILDASLLYKHLYNMIPYHYPHWIVVYGKENNEYRIYEPWEGKECLIPERILKDSLKSFLCRLWGAPQMIILNQKPYI